MAKEDTLMAPKDQSTDALLAEQLRDAKGIDLPSDLKTNPILHRGDETLPAPVTVHEIRSGKYFYIYESETGEKVPCMGYMLGQKLRQRLPSGKFRFTVNDPGIRPKRGTIKCMLHKDDPNREEYDLMGFRTCKKSNITNLHQLDFHMKRRHPQEWAAIEDKRKKAERKEDRDLQHLILDRVAGKEAKGEIESSKLEDPAPLYVSDKDKKKKQREK